MHKFTIAGIDYSKNSPGVVILELDENFDTKASDYIGFSSVKKIATSNKNILYYKKDQFNNDYDQYIWIRDSIMDKLSNVDFVAFEGYAFGASGKVFDIAETTATMKIQLYEKGIPFRIYEPTVVKMFATGKGNAGKVEMNEAYKKLFDPMELYQLPELKSPKEDLIDAFYICKLLQKELMLRYGIVDLKSLPVKQIEIFNRCTKSNPVNILSRDFIVKK
ncbi:MAG: hypothetical protein WC260_01695 [Candidatus Pacearchaeota archaeon]